MMLHRNRIGLCLCIAFLGTVASAPSLLACSVPVFRYAMEHWPADPYEAIVFHRGPLSAAQQSMVHDLGHEGKAGLAHANLSLRIVDLDGDRSKDVLDFWRQLGAETLPWLVVRYPSAVHLPVNVWSGPLTELAVQQLLDSPTRKEIAHRLGRGESAVWLLLEAGDRSKDEAAAELLKSRLAYLAGVLKLPKLEPQDIANGLASVSDNDLRLEFSLLRLSRNDPSEQAFVAMLLGTEADLKESQDPIVFPIFGRGRALYALIGKGINHETIDEGASFLIGKCSCQVKELNPGVDLLFAAKWETGKKKDAASASNASTLANRAESIPETVTISGSDATVPSSRVSPGSSRLLPISGIALVGGFAAVALLAAFAFLSGKK